MRDLKEFVEDYLLAGIIWGTVAVGVVFLLLCLIVLLANRDINTKKKLFLATSGIKTDDKGVDEAGKIISDFLKGALSIKEIEKFSELSDTYKNIFWSNSDIFIKIAREKSKAPKVEIIGWMPFLKWSLIIGLFFLSLSMTINFFVRIINIASSLKDCFWWPFKKVWSYPLFLFMFPGLLIGILIIGLVWFIVIIFKNLILGFVSFVIRKIMISEGMITERRGSRLSVQAAEGEMKEKNKEEKEKNKLEQAKIKAKEMIDAANASVQESRMKFAEINLRELEDKKGELESKVNNCRYNLSSLAEKIEQSQRDLAKSSKELREWEDNFPNIRNQKQDDYFKEFDKILSLNGIEAVEIKDEDFFAYTGTIFILRE